MSDLLSPEIVESFCVEDVTEDEEKRHLAFCLVTDLYSRFSSKALDPEEVQGELCHDEYYHCGLARTIVLSGINPNSGNGKLEMLATLRIVIGAEQAGNSMLPLESMHLITPTNGWDNFTFEGFHPHRAVEFGRFAVSPNCKRGIARQVQFHLLVTKELSVGAYKIAVQNFAKDQVWAIMSPLVAKTVEASGLGLTQAPDVKLNYQQNRALFEKYDKYWMNNTLGYYKFDFRQ